MVAFQLDDNVFLLLSSTRYIVKHVTSSCMVVLCIFY